MDKNGDGKITMDELKAIGLDGLPNFEDLGAEGHHYDVESGTNVPILATRNELISLQNSSCIMKVGSSAYSIRDTWP